MRITLTSRRIPLTILACALACGAAATVATIPGCAGGAERAGAPALGALNADGSKDQRLSDAAARLKQMEEAQAATPGTLVPNGREPRLFPLTEVKRPTGSSTKKPVQPGQGTEAPPIKDGAGANAPAVATEDGAGPNPALPAGPSVADRRQQAVNELGKILREEAAASGSPLVAGARLAALDLFQPGASGAGPAGSFSPRESEIMGAWSAMCAEAGSKLAASGDSGSLAAAVRDAAAKLDSAGGAVLISRSVLCSRVETFGVYNELKKTGDTYKLLAGRPQKAIVYLELDRFASRAANRDGVEGWRVELVQDLSLYAYQSGDASDMLAWRKPDQEITDFSRNRRRDFFIVQLIDLPETLTVGAYRLKVTVRDRSGGATAEAVIPIDVVVDSSAIRASR